MGRQRNANVLVIERDPVIAEKIESLLKERSYAPITVSQKEEAIRLLKKNNYPLAIVGDTRESDSVFESMKDIVMTSPMTSMILITDLPKKEVDEKAEGYGILGHINRKIPPEDLTSLLENFENILKSYDRTAI